MAKKLKVIKIVFTQSPKLFSRLIRWVTDSPVSHVFLEFSVWGQDCVIESTVGGTRIVLAEKAKHDVLNEFTLLDVPEDTITNLMPYLGGHYDYKGMWILGWFYILKRWFNIKKRSFSYNTEATKCSELVAIYLKSLNKYTEVGGWEPEYITPLDIYNFCWDHPQMNRKLNK